MNENLFTLIASMSKSERIYYVRYANPKSLKKTAQHIKVFKTIVKHNILTNEELIKNIKDRTISKKLSHIKKYLFDSIIDYIIFNKRKNYYSDGIFSLLRSRVMFARGLTNAAINNQYSVLNEFEGLSVPYSQGLYLSNAHYALSILGRTEVEKGYTNTSQLKLAKKNLRQVSIYTEYHELFLLHLEIISTLKENTSLDRQEKIVFARKIEGENKFFQDDYTILSITNAHLWSLCFYYVYKFLNEKNLLLNKLETMYSKLVSQINPKNEFEKHDALRYISYTLASVSSLQNNKQKFELNINRLSEHIEQLKLEPKVKRNRLNDSFILLLKLQYAINNQEYKIGTELKNEILNIHKSTDSTHHLYLLILCFIGENDFLAAFQIISPELDEKVKKHEKAPYLLYSLSKVLIFLSNKHYSSALSEIRSLAYFTRKETNDDIYKQFAPLVHAFHNYSRYCYDNNRLDHIKLSAIFERAKLLSEFKIEEITAFQKLLSNWFLYQLSIMKNR